MKAGDIRQQHCSSPDVPLQWDFSEAQTNSIQMPQEASQHTVDRKPADDTYRLRCKQAGAVQLELQKMTQWCNKSSNM
jgi:hypothetical protein